MNAEPYQAVPLGGGDYRIEENGVRCFLFAGRENALLIDSGFGSGDLRALVRTLTDLPILLVNTHADGDHIGCNGQFDSVRMHPGDFDRCREQGGDPSRYAPLGEGDVIDLGVRRFEVLHIPGHTPGSVALFDVEHRLLISGDSVQAGTIWMFGGGRDLDAYLRSLEKLQALAGRFDTVYPSHGPFPVSAGLLPDLIAGASRIRAGEVPGTEAPFPTDAKLYDIGAAKYLV
jgi:glyoxylase-like metal-dependent hydrolase (beta-lactamase superfamily II)